MRTGKYCVPILEKGYALFGRGQSRDRLFEDGDRESVTRFEYATGGWEVLVADVVIVRKELFAVLSAERGELGRVRVVLWDSDDAEVGEEGKFLA